MREDVIRAHAELASVCEHIHLPLQSGSSRDPEGDAPHLRPRALSRPRRADPRARARRGADDRHHRRLPGRDRGRLRARRSRSSSRSATTAPSRSSSRRGAAPRRRAHRGPGAPSGQGGADGAARRARPAHARASAPSASSGARWRCSSRAPRAPTPSACAGARATTRSSTSAGLAGPGELTDVEITPRPARRSPARNGCCARGRLAPRGRRAALRPRRDRAASRLVARARGRARRAWPHTAPRRRARRPSLVVERLAARSTRHAEAHRDATRRADGVRGDALRAAARRARRAFSRSAPGSRTRNSSPPSR